MNRQDYIWVAIRIFGIFLIVMAIIRVPKFIGHAVEAFTYSSIYGSDIFPPAVSDLPADPNSIMSPAVLEKVCQTAVAKSWVDFLTNLAAVTIYLAAGLYLCKSGKLIFRIINNTAPPTPTDS